MIFLHCSWQSTALWLFETQTDVDKVNVDKVIYTYDDDFCSISKSVN